MGQLNETVEFTLALSTTLTWRITSKVVVDLFPSLVDIRDEFMMVAVFLISKMKYFDDCSNTNTNGTGGFGDTDRVFNC